MSGEDMALCVFGGRYVGVLARALEAMLAMADRWERMAHGLPSRSLVGRHLRGYVDELRQAAEREATTTAPR